MPELLDPVCFYRNLPELKTPRLLLRKIRAEDAGDYFEFARDPEVTHYLRWGPHPSIQYTREYISSVLDSYATGQDGPWGIVLLEEGRLVGTIHLMEPDPAHRKADVGVVLARKYWRQGLGSEALAGVLQYCFRKMGLNRVQGLSVAGNLAGRRMKEKCGMSYEGTLRGYACQKGAYQDFDVFAILAGDFHD